MKRYWFFDLDGTLADTDGDIRASWKASLADMGVSCPDFDRDFVAGPPMEEMAKALLPDICTPEFAAELRRRFGEHYDGDGFPNTFEYPGVMDAVRRLKALGARLFIVTNKRYAGAVAMAAKFAWMDVFEKLYAGDMHDGDPSIGRMRKPQLVAFVLKELGADASDAVMVGDTANDFAAASENGVESIAVAWGYGKPGELALAGRVVNSPAELVPAS